LKSPVLALLVVFGCASAGYAQQTSSGATAPPTGYERCLLSAIANEDLYRDEAGVQFRCYGSAAENWFNQLPGGKEVQDANGLFTARYFDGPGYCAHQTKGASGQPTSTFVCVIDRPPLK
jgi:hypothetical protein